MLKQALIGIAWALVGVFPIAALVALIFRFPIPFGAYESGLTGMLRSPIAVLFYGMLGGFPLLTVLGGLAGIAAYRTSGDDAWKRRWRTIGFALGLDFLAVMVLAVLDKIIGPW